MPHPFYFQGNPVEIGSNPPKTERQMDWLLYLIAAMIGGSCGAMAMAVICSAAHKREMDELADAQHYLWTEYKGPSNERH